MKAKSDYEYVIIGAGPAGLQLGHEMEQNGRDYVILEGSDHVGAFFSKFPRHRRLLSINKVFTGYDDTGNQFTLGLEFTTQRKRSIII